VTKVKKPARKRKRDSDSEASEPEEYQPPAYSPQELISVSLDGDVILCDPKDERRYNLTKLLDSQTDFVQPKKGVTLVAETTGLSG